MKQLKPIMLLGFMLMAFSVIGQENTDNRYTLQECLTYALEHNENIIIANLEIDASKAKTGEYLSAGFPQIDATASVNKNFIYTGFSGYCIGRNIFQATNSLMISRKLRETWQN